MKNLMNLFAIAFLFFVTSCQKEEVVEVVYPENPYNYIGQQHNETLDNFVKTYGQTVAELRSPMEKENFIADQIFADKGQDVQLFHQGRDLMGIEKSIPLIDYDFMQYNQLFKKTNLTDKTSTMLTKTINELIEIDGTTAEGIAQVEAKIRALEIEFLKAGESAADFSPAMTYLAVLKYSAEYWNQHGGDGEIQNRAKWWETVLADAAGALVGVGVTLATGGVGAGAAIALSAGFSAAVNTK